MAGNLAAPAEPAQPEPWVWNRPYGAFLPVRIHYPFHLVNCWPTKCPVDTVGWRCRCALGNHWMVRLPHAEVSSRNTIARRGLLLGSAATLLAGCSSIQSVFNSQPTPTAEVQQPAALGAGDVKVGL